MVIARKALVTGRESASKISSTSKVVLHYEHNTFHLLYLIKYLTKVLPLSTRNTSVSVELLDPPDLVAIRCRPDLWGIHSNTT